MELGVGRKRIKMRTQRTIIEGVKWDTRGDKMIKQLLESDTYTTEDWENRKPLGTLKTQ